MSEKERLEKLKAAEAIGLWKLGDRVRIRHLEFPPGQIVELRGALGPEGVQIYRVRIPRKPNPIYIEVLGDQMVAVPN